MYARGGTWEYGIEMMVQWFEEPLSPCMQSIQLSYQVHANLPSPP